MVTGLGHFVFERDLLAGSLLCGENFLAVAAYGNLNRLCYGGAADCCCRNGERHGSLVGALCVGNDSEVAYRCRCRRVEFGDREVVYIEIELIGIRYCMNGDEVCSVFLYREFSIAESDELLGCDNRGLYHGDGELRCLGNLAGHNLQTFRIACIVRSCVYRYLILGAGHQFHTREDEIVVARVRRTVAIACRHASCSGMVFK